MFQSLRTYLYIEVTKDHHLRLILELEKNLYRALIIWQHTAMPKSGFCIQNIFEHALYIFYL